MIIYYISYFSKRYLLYVYPNIPCVARHTPKRRAFCPSQTNNGIHEQPPPHYYFFIPKIFLFFFSLSLWSLVSLCRPLSDPPAAADDDA